MKREAIASEYFSSCLLPFVICMIVPALVSCDSEVIRQRDEQIRHQQEEIFRQRKEIEEIKLARQIEENKRRDCSRAFSDFEKAQTIKAPEEAAALYRQGLRLCPDDDVAHYELGKILISSGKFGEAEQEFEAALRINPSFSEARRQLDAVQKRK